MKEALEGRRISRPHSGGVVMCGRNLRHTPTVRLRRTTSKPSALPKETQPKTAAKAL